MAEFRVLVIRAGALGDTVFATSIIEPLRHRYGAGLRLDWLAKAGVGNVFAADPRIARVFSIHHRKPPLLLSPPKLAVMAESWRRPYDMVVNLEFGPLFDGLMRSIRARQKIGAPYLRVAPPQECHAVETLKLIYEHFMDDTMLRLATPSVRGTDPTDVRARFGLPNDYLVLAPSNSHTRGAADRNPRAWPLAYWKDLLDRLSAGGTEAVLIGAGNEAEFFKELGPLPDGIVSLVGRTNLPDLIGVVRGARMVITTDTGPSHIAAAVGTPVTALIGPTDPYKTGPYSTSANHVHILRTGIECSPCYHTPRRDACRENRCMLEIGPEQVLQAVRAHTPRKTA